MLKTLLFVAGLFLLPGLVCAQETRTLKHDYFVQGAFVAHVEERGGVATLLVTDSRAEQYFLRNGQLAVLARKGNHALVRYTSRPYNGYRPQRSYPEERGGDLIIPIEALNRILAGEHVPTPVQDRQDDWQKRRDEAAYDERVRLDDLEYQKIAETRANVLEMLIQYKKGPRK